MALTIDTHASASPWLRGFVWATLALLDATLVVIGIHTYYLSPLPGPYPFMWLFDLLRWTPSTEALGVMTFLSIGVTPTAALLLLVNSMARLVVPAGLHPTFRLLSGAFCLVVGLGFLSTLGVYVLRAPWVLDWDREALAGLVHLLIALRGFWLMAEAAPWCSPATIRIALAGSTLWVVGVTIPQHPWLVVWLHSLQDWLGG